jgi:hypothetical protein
MAEKPKTPAIGDALRGTVDYAVRSREGLREGLLHARSARLDPPPPQEHARRFLFGVSLPITLMRLAWAEAPVRRSALRRLAPPVACVALFAAVGIGSLLEDLYAARHQPLALHVESKDDDDDSDADDDDVATDDEVKKEVKQAAADVASAVRSGADDPVTEARLQASAAAVKEAARKARKAKEARATSPAPAPKGRWPVLQAVMTFVESKIAKLIGTLSVLEWILVWIGREHHDQIAWEVSQLSGVPGEPLPHPPRLRLDLAWVRMKGWRAVRFLIFLALAAPVASLVGQVPYVGGGLAVVIEGAWTAYWASVFAIGNSFLVWERPLGEGEAPWFVRRLYALGRAPVVGVAFRVCARVLTRVTRNVWPACMAFERTPWESAGLAALRGVASIPVVYIVTRPFFAPAATHAWLARATDVDDHVYRR